MIPVLVSQSKGIAVFDDGKGLGLLNVNAPEQSEKHDARDLYRALSGAKDLETIEVVDKPALLTHMAIRRAREDALCAALMLLEPRSSDKLRAVASETLNSLEVPQAITYVKGVLLSTALPADASIDKAGRWKNPLQDILRDLPSLQPRIRVLRNAWAGLPDLIFQGENRSDTLAKAIRSGLFLEIILGPQYPHENPLTTALGRYSRSLTNLAHPHSLEIKESDTPSVQEDESLGEKIWLIAPWRTAWMSSRWQNIRAELASVAASDLWSSSLSYQHTQMARIHLLEEAWATSRLSAQSKTVASILSMLNGLGNRSDIPAINIPRQNISSAKPLARDILHSKLNWLDDPRIPKEVGDITSISFWTFALFDATESQLSGRLGGTPHRFTRDDWQFLPQAPINSAPSPHNLAQLVQASLETCLPFRVSMNSSFLSFAPEVFGGSAQSRAGEEVRKILTECIKAIRVYYLGRLFDRGGAMVYVRTSGSSKSIPPHRTQAVLLNPEKKLSFEAHGSSGTILGHLRDRLSADLRSDLPQDHCGWKALREIYQGAIQSSDSIANDPRSLQAAIVASGFTPELLQIKADAMRLNPDLVASASDQTGSTSLPNDDC